MVYKQSAFAAPDHASIFDLMDRYMFANLVTHHKDQTEVSHLPFILERDEGACGTLYFHLAKANPHCAALLAGVQCTVIFNGPQSYISPRWYPAEAEDHIPTWNYATVHAHGPALLITDPEKVFWQMDQIHRKQDKGPLLSVSEEEKESMIPHVRLFRMPVENLESVFKLSQNREFEDGEGARRALAASPDTGKQELAGLMRQSLDKRRGES